MNPRDFLDLADELCTGSREVDWRAAVSRAYYAAFHVARQFLTGLGFDVPRADQAHAYLWLRLSNCGHPDVIESGLRLNALRKQRNWADYELDRTFKHSLAMTQVADALAVVDLLDDTTATPSVLVVITDSIRTYERDVLRQVTWRS